jgi:hypothetical protein
MLRAMGVAVALAMTPSGASAIAVSYQELPASWAASYLPLPAGWEFIEVGDWNLITYNDSQLALVMAARQPMHIWVRSEYKRVSERGTRSVRTLYQVECNTGRTRIVSQSFFGASNHDSMTASFNEVEPWQYPAPGTMGEVPLRVLCD